MPKRQTLARFYGGSSLDAIKCAYLFEKIENEEKKHFTSAAKARLPDKIRAFKNSVSQIDLSGFGGGITLPEFEKFAMEKKLRVRIWKQKTHKSKFFLEYESALIEEELEPLDD